MAWLPIEDGQKVALREVGDSVRTIAADRFSAEGILPWLRRNTAKSRHTFILTSSKNHGPSLALDTKRNGYTTVLMREVCRYKRRTPQAVSETIPVFQDKAVAI
jgi:hypothetical protein